LILHGGRVAWLDNNDRHLAAAKETLFHGHARQWEDVAIGLHVRQREQQLVGYGQLRTGTIVFGTDEQDSRLMIVRQVICKSTDCLPDLISITGRFLSFGSLRFPVL